MEIICNQNELNNSIQLVSKAVASKPTHPILANILLTADQGTNKISLTGYDLSLGIQTIFVGTVKDSGAITIPAKYFLEIVNKLPNESPINIDLQDSSEDIILKSSKAVFNLKGKFIDDYPNLPIVEKGTVFTTDPTSFLRCIKLTVFSADSDSGPGEILKGVNFTFTKGNIEAASTDRHRLSIASVNNINNDFHQESEINIDEEPLSITIPTRSLREIEKLLTLKSNEKLLKIFYDKGQIIFNFKDQIITSGTLEGKFPPYRALLPDKFYKIFRFDRVELINVLERISVFRDFRENRSIVKIDLNNEENYAIFSSDAKDIGKANESLPLDLVEGQDDKQFINTRPYLKAERVINSEGELYIALEDIEEGCAEPFHKDLSNPEEIKSIEQKTKWRHLGTAISSIKGMVFNVSYLLEGLRVISSSHVLLKCTVSNKPALLVSETHPNEFTYLVMPCGFR
jgi:DNA polymerase-3 subunit beta